MNRNYYASNSPRLPIASPIASPVPSSRKQVDLSITTQKNLPSIRERTAPHTKKFFSSTSSDRIVENPSTRSINFFDIQSPVNEKKLALVKNALDKKTNQGVTEKSQSSSENSPDLFQKRDLKVEISAKPLYFVDKTTPLSDSSRISNPDKLKHAISSESTLETSSNLVKVSTDNNLSLQDLSTNDQFAEIVNTLKNELGISKKNLKLQNNQQIELRVLYEQDINRLTQQNISLEQELENANRKIKDLKNSNSKQLEEISEIVNQHQEGLFKKDKEIQALTEEVQEKSQEMGQLQEQLKKSEFNRKKYSESLKELELELSLLNKKYLKLEKKYEELKVENALTKIHLNNEKNKNFELEKYVQELENVKNQKKMLQNKIEEIQETTKDSKNSYYVLMNNYENLRINFKEKEKTYQDMIQDLLDQVSSEKEMKSAQLIETYKLKKAITLRETDFISTYSKEELNRYQQKLQTQEKNLVDHALEIEKLKKNIEYYRTLITSKNEIISKLESQQVYEKKEKTSLREILENCKNLLEKLLFCQNCNIGKSKLVVEPCLHRICNQCELRDGLCIVCFQKFIETKEYIQCNSIQEIIQFIENLYINNS